MHKGKFYIGVMRTDGSGERLLTENYYQEAPSWSPNGRVLVFYRETKAGDKGKGFSAKLWSIDITGYNEKTFNENRRFRPILVLFIIKVTIILMQN